MSEVWITREEAEAMYPPFVRRAADGSIIVDPHKAYQSPGVQRQLQAAERLAKRMGLRFIPKGRQA